MLGPPDLKVSAVSLNKWLFEDTLGFAKIGEEYESNIKQILENRNVGVFHSSPSGIIIATIPRDNDIAEDQNYAVLRQFAFRFQTQFWEQ